MQSWHTARELAQTAEYNRLAAEANQPGNPPREIIWTGEPLALQAFSQKGVGSWYWHILGPCSFNPVL